MPVSVRLAEHAFDPAAELETFQASLEGQGAVVSFCGFVRPDGHCGPVTSLFLDSHPTRTLQSLREIATEASVRFSLPHLHVVHRRGTLIPGEAIVFVAAAAIHRRAAFDAADYAMDRLKTDAFFWKREDGVGGSRWVEPSLGDHEDRARWSE